MDVAVDVARAVVGLDVATTSIDVAVGLDVVALDVDVGVDVVALDVAVDVATTIDVAVGLDVALDVGVDVDVDANMASSGDTVRTVGERLAVDGAGSCGVERGGLPRRAVVAGVTVG